MSNRQPISKDDFQMRFVFGVLLTILVTVVGLVAIFVNPNIFGALVPLVIVGLGFGLWKLGGKIYDRRYKSSTD